MFVARRVTYVRGPVGYSHDAFPDNGTPARPTLSNTTT